VRRIHLPGHDESPKQDREDGKGKCVASSGWQRTSESVNIQIGLIGKGRLTRYHRQSLLLVDEKFILNTRGLDVKVVRASFDIERSVEGDHERSRNSDNGAVVGM
jgi:hypothetical protein